MNLRVRASLEGRIIFEKNISKFPLLIGRQSPATLRIPDENVSALHAKLEWDGETLTVEDLQSKNGTYVNGVRIQAQKITVPCVLSMGPRFQLKIEKIASTALSNEVELLPGQAFWYRLRDLRPRTIFLALTLLGLLLGGASSVWTEMNPVYSILLMQIQIWGSFILCGLFAAILALPGWLIRGFYNIKPLLLGSLVAVALSWVGYDLILPLTMMAKIGFAAKIILPLILTCAQLSFWNLFAMTTIPHQWFSWMRWGIMGLCLTVGFTLAQMEYRNGRQPSLQKIFASSETTIARAIAGSPVTPDALAEELNDSEISPRH